ncbi:MAG: SAM-dependent methyltransferase [Glaciecola sp.]|jgi:SAM-dependent methyltransferase
MAESTDLQAHWDHVWSSGDATGRSWFEREAASSMREITAVAGKGATVIDVGAGASPLVDALLDAGFARPAVLDISAHALARTRARLGDRADAVDWVVGDVTQVRLPRTFDVWHDRAVLHFLTTDEAVAAYASSVGHHVAVGGHAILATFSPDGPSACSGLDVRRYDGAGLLAVLGKDWKLQEHHTEVHQTPAGALQEFTWARLQRTRGG